MLIQRTSVATRPFVPAATSVFASLGWILTSNLASAAVQEASLRAQIAASHEIIDISTRSLALIRRQFELGAVARLDVAAQEAALAQVQQTLPPLQKQLEQTRNLLAAFASEKAGT